MKLFNKPLEAVILDVDGVLLNPSRLEEYMVMAATASGLPVEPLVKYLAAIWEGTSEGHVGLHLMAAQIWKDISDANADRFVQEFRAAEHRHLYDPIPGSFELVNWLKRQGVPVAICTSNDLLTLKRRFEPLGLDLDQFDALLTGDSEYTKPHPQTLDALLMELKVTNPKHVLFVGDWYVDVKMARHASTNFIAVLSGFWPKSAFINEGVAEDHILERLDALQDLIEI